MPAVNLFDIQHFCTDDGPGIRATVFMKGCPLRCQWCHNPESQTAQANLLFYPEKCARCQLCADACAQGAHRFDEQEHTLERGLCDACGDCARVCAQQALSVAGKTMDAEAVIDEVAGDLPFYTASGGGVTFSGGEPLMQPDALVFLLERCAQRKLHTAVETCSQAAPEVYRRVFSRADLMICDLKAVSSDLHRAGTGAGSQRVLANLRLLFREYRGRIWINIPVIPGFNDTQQEFEKMAQFLHGQPVERARLMPFHSIGLSKYRAMGLDSRYSSADRVSAERLSLLKEILVGSGVPVA